MKAILLAGGFGTRLRPLTLNTPKPIVPIFDRPFLCYQIDLLKQLPEIDEVILSLNYQPTEIEKKIGTEKDLGVRIRYIVEPNPLGTGGAIKFASPYINDTIIVFNGDVLTKVDLRALLKLHRKRKARATIVLTSVNDPASYGLVETDKDGNVQRFLEKPSPDEINCDTINAGVYILEPDTLNHIPPDTKYSIERGYFPSLIKHKETFVAHIESGYWLDIGTPESYMQAHRDIMRGLCHSPPFENDKQSQKIISPTASIDAHAEIEGPCFIGASARIEAGASIGAYSVISRSTVINKDTSIKGSIIWPETIIGANVTVQGAIIGHSAKIDSHSTVGPGVVLGDDSVVTAHTKIGQNIKDEA